MQSSALFLLVKKKSVTLRYRGRIIVRSPDVEN